MREDDERRLAVEPSRRPRLPERAALPRAAHSSREQGKKAGSVDRSIIRPLMHVVCSARLPGTAFAPGLSFIGFDRCARRIRRRMQQDVLPEGCSPGSRPGAEAVLGRSGRIASIDLLRGLVMALMALDHTRDFFGNGRLQSARRDRAGAVPDAMGHSFLRADFRPPRRTLGLSLRTRPQQSPRLSRFLLTRGLWLILIEFTLIDSAGASSLDFPTSSAWA